MYTEVGRHLAFKEFMKCDPKLKRADFWKIQCCVCGVNTDLLKDDYHRIICREHLNEYEFNEVEHEGLSESDKEVESKGLTYLSSSGVELEDLGDNWIPKTFNYAEGIE